MEPLDSVRLTSQTDVINVEDVECGTPCPMASCAGSDCSISAAKAVAAAEAAIEERNDVMLRLMGHLIPVTTVPEEGSTSETDTSIVSSASTLKRRLHNLPTSNEAVKLADRVAVLNRRIRKERDLYLHLQGLSNRIDEKDEGDLSTTDSSKTINSISNRHQGKINNARARRRERINSGSAISQHQMSSDLQLCSPGLSSPEPLTLKEIRDDFTEQMDQLSSPIKARYCFGSDSIMNRMPENVATGLSNSAITQELKMADETISSRQNAPQFFNQSFSRSDRKFCPVVGSDCDNLTDIDDGHVGIPNFHFDNANYFEDDLSKRNLSSEAENPRIQATTSSTASSTGVDYPYVTRKRTPMKFGGYRPSTGMIFRNLSSDSESDAISDRIVKKGLRSQKFRRGNWTDFETCDAEEQELRASEFSSRNFCPEADRIMEVEPFSTEKMEALEDRLLSPVASADSTHFFEKSNPSQRRETCSELQIPAETGWASDRRNQPLNGDIGNMDKQNTSMDGNADNFHSAQSIGEGLAGSVSQEQDDHIPWNLTYDTSTDISLKPVDHVSFSKKTHTDILPSLPPTKPEVSSSSQDSKTLIFGQVRSPNHGQAPSAKASGITNQQSVLISSRSHPESIGKSEDPGIRAQNHDHRFVAITSSAYMGDDDLTGDDEHPKIPPLEIESLDCSQSHSLSSDGKEDGTARSSLDVNALIQALSDVSLKQKNSTNGTNRSMAKLKSPLGYGNRFSGSSGPRSSEYTPAPGGSRQSLTSLDVSEAYSMKVSKGELTARRQATPFLKSDNPSARSASRTGEVLEALSTSPPNIKKSPVVRPMALKDLPSEDDFAREKRPIPVVAKVDKTNIVCSKHPLRIKSMTKLISPRKYPNLDFRVEIADQLTSRTEVLQSSGRSRKSFRSMKSVQHETKVHGKKTNGLQSEINGTGRSAPLSGRRHLEPLNLVPKIKPELLISMNRKLKRREKTANDLSEIINSQSEAGSERTTTANSSKSPSRRSPRSRTNMTDLPVPRSARRLKNPGRSRIHDTDVSSGGRTPGELSTEQDQKFSTSSIKGRKNWGVSSERSSVTSGNVLYLHSERLSLSSGDYGGKTSWSPSPRDEDLTEDNNTYDSEDQLYDQQEPINESGRKISEAMDQDAQSIKLSNLTTNSLARSFKNCVHVNDLQDGREVTLPCGNARCQEDSLREIELFNRLPNEIIGSLTRHASLGTKVTKNLQSTEETPSTIGNLTRNIQENNDQWIKNLQSNDDVEIARSGSADDKVSSAESSVRNGKSESRNRSNIPQKIPLVVRDSCCSQLRLQKSAKSTDPLHSRNVVSGPVDLGQSDPECSSPFHGNIRQAAYNNEPVQLDSQRSSLTASGPNSHRNTYRSLTGSTDDGGEVSKRQFAYGMTERSAIESCNFKDEQDVSCDSQTVRLCDIEVVLNTTKETIIQQDTPKTPASARASDSTLDTDQHGRNTSSLNNEVKSSQEDDVEAVETIGDELEDRESLKYLTKCNDNGLGVCEKKSSPSSNRSTKSQTVTQHHQDGVISSSPSIKPSLSMSKLNSSADSKWDVTVIHGANSVKKSQDRFPFTMSESASRKTSKFKVVADVNLDQLIQDQNAHAKPNDPVSTQNPIPAKYGDRIIPSTDTIDAEKQTDNCEESTIRQLTPFLEEFTSKISHDSPDNLNAQISTIGLNYMSYGCREEPRSLMPSVKEMVKKLSAKLRYRAKRCQDTEETNIEILYRNIRCRCESGEGSSSPASLYQSQLLNTSNKLPSSIRRSNDGSRASSGRAMKPRRNQECISMSMQHSPRKGCDQNDLWIQEFDSDSEFDTLPVPCRQKPNDSHSTKPESRTNSPANDRYSMFLARRKLHGIRNESDNHEIRMNSVSKCCEGGDSENVRCKRQQKDVDGLFNEVPEMVMKSERTPANSTNDITNEFQIDPVDGSVEDSTANSGCCCFKIYRFFVKSVETEKRSAKSRRRIKVWKKK